jgi:hypothetical protein
VLYIEIWYSLTKIVLREKIVLVIEKKLLKFEDKGQENWLPEVALFAS